MKSAIEKLHKVLHKPPYNRGEVKLFFPGNNDIHARALLVSPINPDLSARGSRRNLIIDVKIKDGGKSDTKVVYLPTRVV